MAKRAVKKNGRIRSKVEQAVVDAIQYKPSSPMLKPVDVYMTVDMLDTEGNFSQDFWPDGDLTPFGLARFTKIIKDAQMRAED